MDELAELAYRVVETERRLRNVMRYVEVTEVDPAKGLVKVVDRGGGPGKDLPSDWRPWMEMGGPQGVGNATTWKPPRVGQRGMWLSPSGNLAEGIIMPGGFSDKAGQPSQDGSAHVETNGKTKITATPDGYVIETDNVTIKAKSVTITAGQSIKLDSPTVEIDGFIRHTGDMVTTGTHTDRNGKHK
jgi:phage baseplate assembly protein V